MKDKERIVIAGGSGFLGTALAKKLVDENYDVVIFTRSPENNDPDIRQVLWDGKTLGDWQWYLEGAHGLINFTGRSVHCVSNKKNREELMSSRIDSVNVLAEAVRLCVNPPAVWVQSSSLGIYGDCDDTPIDESAPHGEDFSAQLCEAWELALEQADLPRTRKVVLRIGLVLGPDGGALQSLAAVTRWFLGGVAGTGEQYISWLHIDDFNEMVLWSLRRDKISGTLNATGPLPVTNAEFMQKLRTTLGRPWCPPAPAFVVSLFVRWVLQSNPELALHGRRCRPTKFRQLGFRFRYTSLDYTLQKILTPEEVRLGPA